MDGDGQSLVLDVGVGGVRRSQGSRQVPLEGGEATRRARGDDPSMPRRPPLVAVLTEEEELLAGTLDRVADLLEPPEVERLPRRAAGDDGDRRDLRSQIDEDLGCGRVDLRPGRVVDDRRQGAVEVEPDDGAIGYADQVRVTMLTLQRRELHASSQSRNVQALGRAEVKLVPIGRRDQPGLARTSQGAGEDHRQVRVAHAGVSRDQPLDPEVEGELLRGVALAAGK